MADNDGRVPKPAPGSHPSGHAVSGVDGASRVDPSREVRCECQEIGKLNPTFASWYDEDLELPFVDHAPGECKCTNGLAKYRSGDGTVRWLCSNCKTFGDVLVRDSQGQSDAQ